MSKKHRRGPQASTVVAPTAPPPVMHGPPQALPPPPNGLVLRLAPGRDALLADLPNGRLATIPCTPDGMDLLVGILHRVVGDLRPPAAHPTSVRWPRGLAVRFAPPDHSPWRDAKWFPFGADFCPMTIDCEMANGSVLAKAPDGQSYTINPKWLQVDGRVTKVPGRGAAREPMPTPSLEDLGL